MPYIETLTQIFEVVASVFLQHEQLALFVGGAAVAAATLCALQDAAAQQQLAVLDAFVEDFKIAKRAHTLRSKQVHPAVAALRRRALLMRRAGQHVRREEDRCAD